MDQLLNIQAGLLPSPFFPAAPMFPWWNTLAVPTVTPNFSLLPPGFLSQNLGPNPFPFPTLPSYHNSNVSMLFKTEPVEEINSILMNYVAPPPAPLQQLQNNIQGFQRIKMEVKQEPNTGYDHGDYSTGGQALQGNPGPFVLGGGLPQLHGQTSKNVHGTCSLGNFCIMSTYKRKDRAPYKVYCGTCGAEFHCFCLGRSNSPLTNKEFHCCGIKAICSAKKAKQGIYFHKRTVQVRNFRVKSEISVYGSFNF